MASKTPTLVQLRKLAKRKGYAFAKIYKLPPEDGDKRVFFYAFIAELWGSTTIDITSGTKAKVAGHLFAIFSALPDKERAR